MKFDPEVHQRRSIRLKGYNYSQAGAYFVTICTQERRCLLGEVLEEEMVSNDAGRTVRQVWEALPRRFPSVELDLFVVMPNHLHGIAIIEGNVTSVDHVGATLVVAHDHNVTRGRAGTRPAPTTDLGDIIGEFKSITTNRYIAGVKCSGWLAFSIRLWQRNYYEHVIRSGSELDRVRQYIMDNPLKWALDPENPAQQSTTAAIRDPWRV